MTLLYRLLIMIVIGFLCSFFPWLHIGAVMGFPAVLLNSLILTILSRNLK